MHHLISILPLLFLSLNPSISSQNPSISSQNPSIPSQNPSISSQNTVQCPLNFTILTTLARQSTLPPNLKSSIRCQYLRLGLRLVLSDYLRRTNSFLPPLNSSTSCLNSYQISLKTFIPDLNFNIRAECKIQANWIGNGCLNISTRSQYEAGVPLAALRNLDLNCNRSLAGPACGPCITSVANAQASEFGGNCSGIAAIYAAAIANPYGPADLNTAKCLFFVDLSTGEKSNNEKSSRKGRIAIISVSVVAFVFVIGLSLVCVYRRRSKLKSRKKSVGFDGLDLITGNGGLREFSIEEVKAASKSFSGDNVIGSGGYGNVYRGVLEDGSEVAMKRFKNLSAAGDESFKHELEIIASVRHVNLVGLIGYCTWTTELEGHQRIIVCELMKNGSLYDHLFGSKVEKLSWPVRFKIALGTARGLAYLHNGAQPGIIHRDVKSSNILLDEMFEPKVADFGLAKFTPDGMTHLSTRVSGTMGYVAPEYALYGRLTERSDVYSFGVVLLELLSGKKALMASNDGQLTMLADWVWSLVREGRALDVIEEMLDLDPPELMEKYVMIAVLCSHTQLYARPTMTEVVKLLENDIPLPTIPDRPDPFVANISDLETSVSTAGSGAFVANINDLETSVSATASAPPATSSG